MKRSHALVLLALILPAVFVSAGPAAAQGAVPGPTLTRAQQADQPSAVRSVASLFEMVKGYLIAAAEQMPEDLYSYRPTPEVRTFGQLVGHVANAQYGFCNGATGIESMGPENFEERTTKAGLVEALKSGFDACGKAYAMDDAMALQEVSLFGMKGTRLWALTFNVAHSFEHYGNVVTYMRANGLVPPSSQRGM